MNKRHVLSKFILSAAAIFALAACGGGDSDEARLPAGKVGTSGDGINQAEFDALQCGMNRDQVAAIVADQPTSFGNIGAKGDAVLIYDIHGLRTYVGFDLDTDLLQVKQSGVLGTSPTQSLIC